MSYEFAKPLDTSAYTPLGEARLNYEGDFVLQLDDIDKVSANNKSFLNFRFRVAEGAHKGQQHTESFFLWQENKANVDITIRIMASVCRALNGGADAVFKGASDLVGKRCMVTRIADGEYKGNPQYASRNWRAAGTVVTVPPTSGTADVKIKTNEDGTVTAELQNDPEPVEEVEPADIPW